MESSRTTQVLLVSRQKVLRYSAYTGPAVAELPAHKLDHGPPLPYTVKGLVQCLDHMSQSHIAAFFGLVTSALHKDQGAGDPTNKIGCKIRMDAILRAA